MGTARPAVCSASGKAREQKQHSAPATSRRHCCKEASENDGAVRIYKEYEAERRDGREIAGRFLRE